MSKRGRANWLVEVHSHRDGDITLYGPYTMAQADRVVKQMERFFARQAKALDAERVDEMVSSYSIGRWAPGEMLRAPTRPDCPECGVKLGVWTSEYGEQETYGVCNNTECEVYKASFDLREHDGRWIIDDLDDSSDGGPDREQEEG